MRIVTVIAIGMLAVISSHAQNPGQAVYQSNCAGCHGLDGRGGEHAPNIATAQTVQQLTDTELLRILRDGISVAGMPAFGSRLSGEQLSIVAGYLRILQGEQKMVPRSGNADEGQKLFFGKAACSDCHMVRGKGGFLAGDLSSYAAAHSVEQIRAAIINPNGNFDPRHPGATVASQNGERYTGVIRNEDNFSLQLQTPDGAFHLFDKSEVTSVAREKRSLMPADYGTRLGTAEINDVISYLAAISANQPKQAEDTSEW